MLFVSSVCDKFVFPFLDFMIRKLEEIHPHVENGCQLFLLEQGYKVDMLITFIRNCSIGNYVNV